MNGRRRLAGALPAAAGVTLLVVGMFLPWSRHRASPAGVAPFGADSGSGAPTDAVVSDAPVVPDMGVALICVGLLVAAWFAWRLHGFKRHLFTGVAFVAVGMWALAAVVSRALFEADRAGDVAPAVLGPAVSGAGAAVFLGLAGVLLRRGYRARSMELTDPIEADQDP